MSLEEFSLIGEIIGGLAVLVTLMFLVIELRSNARTLRANTNAESYKNWADQNSVMSQHPDRVAISQTFDPTKTWDDFTPEQQASIQTIARSSFQRFQSLHFQYAAGILDEKVWQHNLVWCSSLVSYPVWKTIWENEKTQPVYSTEFVFAIESAPVVSVSIGNISD